jgi:multidrug/hemolysin transport system permease protein
MKSMISIVRRNLLNYFYDKTSIFFSFLSVFILILVYAVFLGKLQKDGIASQVGDIEGIGYLVDTWLIAGLLSVSSFTVPLAVMSDMVSDLENRIFDDFLVAPIPRRSIVFGYVISSFVIGTIMVTVTFILGQIYILTQGGDLYSLLEIVSILLMIMLSTATFSALSFFLISLVRSVNAASTLNTLVGTLIGFFAGIYVPFVAFNETFANILKLNPAAQLVSAFRRLMMQGSLDGVFEGAPAGIREAYEVDYGVVISSFGFDFSLWTTVLYAVVAMALFFFISTLRIKAFKR